MFGLAHGCLGTAVVSPATMLAPMPATLSFQEAATTPTVFITGALGVASLGGLHLYVVYQKPPCLLTYVCSLSLLAVEMALERAAGMTSNDRVLVHAAAGGVGLAAIQVVQAKGAVVVATAGGTAKRLLLHGLGVQHVLGSRDTAFVSEAAQLGGATVVLNSLTSSGMVAGSLATLGAGGRFVEISKRDIWSAARVAQGELRSRRTCT